MKKIMIVDDDPAVRQLIGSLIEKKIKNVAVFKCKDAHQAFSNLFTNKFNLLITDIHLTDKKGTDIINTIQRNSELQDMPIIIITSGYERDFITKHLPIPDKVQLISKPLDPDLMINTVRFTLQI